MFDPDAFEERAAIKEFDGGMSRLDAETQAAADQGVARWEALDAVAKRIVGRIEHNRQQVARGTGKNAMPTMQPGAAQENGPLSERDGHGRSGADPLLALQPQRGGIL